MKFHCVPRNAIFRAPVKNFVKPKNSRDTSSWQFRPLHFKSVRNDFKTRAHDTKKKPVANLIKIKFHGGKSR